VPSWVGWMRRAADRHSTRSCKLLGAGLPFASLLRGGLREGRAGWGGDRLPTRS
jgi:hypothetical protein